MEQDSVVQSIEKTPLATPESPTTTGSHGKPPLATRETPSSTTKRKRAASPAASGSPSKKQKLAPSSASRVDFQLANPFVRIRMREDTYEDKFSFGKVDLDVLKSFFVRGPGKDIKKTLEAFHGTEGQELKYRAALCQLFTSFHIFTKGKTRILDTKKEGEQEKSTSNSQGSSQTPVFSRVFHEYGDALEGKQSADFVVQTFPKSKVKEALEDAQYWGEDEDQTLKAAKMEVKNWRSSLLVDGKDSNISKLWLDKYAYQVGLYGVQIVLDNLEKNFVRPFYMLCISDEVWNLATLDPLGIIEVKDNEIDIESYNTFQKMQAMRFKWLEKKKVPTLMKGEPLLHENLCAMLKSFNAKHGSNVIEDRKYLVGYFYIDPMRYVWDGSLSKLTSKEPLFNDTLKLMEGLLSVVVGDKVFKWTKDDIKHIFKEKQREEEEWCEEREK